MTHHQTGFSFQLVKHSCQHTLTAFLRHREMLLRSRTWRMEAVRRSSTSHWHPKPRCCHPRNPLTAGQRAHINGTASRESRTPISTPPPQTSRKRPERRIISRRSSTVNYIAAHRTTPALITGTTNSTILPQNRISNARGFHSSDQTH